MNRAYTGFSTQEGHLVILEAMKCLEKFRLGTFPYFSQIFKIFNQNVFKLPSFSNTVPKFKFLMVNPMYNIVLLHFTSY